MSIVQWMERKAARLALAVFIGASIAAGGLAQAQTFSVNAITASTPNFQIVAAAGGGGETVFRMNSSTAAVTKISGNGSVVKGAPTRATITIRCTGGGGCNGATATVTVQATGTPSARVGAVSNFDMVSGTATVVSESLSAGVLTATVSGWTSSNQNRTVLLAMDIPVNDDTVSTATTGTSQYLVTVTPGGGTGTGTATITVRRQIAVAKTADLSFGALRAPTTGSGTVTISQSNGARSAGGTNPPVLLTGLTSGRAVFDITGTPSTTVAISTTPTSSLDLVSGGDTITTTLVRSASTGTLSAAGALTVGVGGVLTVPANQPGGDYTGSFTLTVNYN